MTSASGACAATIAALAIALAPAGADHAAAATRLGYPDLPAALPASAGVPGAGVGPAVRTISTTGSLNWAGYAVNRHRVRFRLVRATFFVPYLNCAKSPGKTKSSAWAGLDGYVGHPDSVEQIGIGANCSATGVASYFAWFEMFPFAQRKLAMKIRAGDSVTVQVSYNPAHKDFRLSLTDHTRGEHATRLRQCPNVTVSGKRVTCPRSSAEVIAEAPATEVGPEPGDLAALRLWRDQLRRHLHYRRRGQARRHRLVQLGRHQDHSGQRFGRTVLARPTSVQADMFDTYWLGEG